MKEECYICLNKFDRDHVVPDKVDCALMICYDCIADQHEASQNDT